LEVGSVACTIDTSFQPDAAETPDETVKKEPSAQEQTKVDIPTQPEIPAYEEKKLATSPKTILQLSRR